MFKLLDLFCCAGGAGEGYKLAGFDVTGVDIEPQPKNPHRFVQADALEYLAEHWEEYDAIHASPPCQAYSKANNQWKGKHSYPDLIDATRSLLNKTNKLWVIENVPNSPLKKCLFLNGSTFGIKVHRPRIFETNFQIEQPEVPFITPLKMGRKPQEGDVIQPVGHFSGVKYAAKEMGLPWMQQYELSQAIPPAYTKYIGERMINILNCRG